MEITQGHLLGGRVRHDQPVAGHRTGIEPVLLAASIPARPGQRVLESGSGAGAAMLCLAWRVPGIFGLGIEREGALAALAADNAAANGFADLRFEAGAIEALKTTEKFDHAFANPPWHRADGTASPDGGQEAARRAGPGLFADWARAMAGPLRHRGTLSLIVAADFIPDCLAALAAAGCGSPALFPFWPKPGRAAKLVLLRGVKGGRGPCRMLAGMVLHDVEAGYTPAAQAVLRDGAALADDLI